MSQTVNSQLERNQAAYDAVRRQMEEDHLGRVVLLHDGEVVEVYNDKDDAYKIGREKYGLGNFSLVNVGQQPIDLGFLRTFLPKPGERV